MLKRKPVSQDDYSCSDEKLHDDRKITFDPDSASVDEILADLILNPAVDPEGSTDEIIAALADDVPSNEVTAPAILRSNEVTTPPAILLSNKVTARLRRSDLKDRELLEGIQYSASVFGAADPAALVRIYTPPNNTPSSASDGTPLSPSNDNAVTAPIRLPTHILTTSWGETGDRAKLAFANEALAFHEDDDRESGKRPVSWSLNLSPERESEALSHPSGFVRYLSRLLNRALERKLGFVPLYWFIVDSEKGRLHLHGGILASPDQLPLIKAAMIHAGGKWQSSGKRKDGGKEHQFHANPDRCDYGWIKYPVRNKGQVKLIIGKGEQFAFIGKELRRDASWLYGEYQQLYRERAQLD